MKIVCPKQSLAPEGRAGGAVGAQSASLVNIRHHLIKIMLFFFNFLRKLHFEEKEPTKPSHMSFHLHTYCSTK